MRRRQAVIVTDAAVAGHHLTPLRHSLAAHGIADHPIVLPSGEGTKDLAHFGRLVDEILGHGIERGTMLVALGAGGWRHCRLCRCDAATRYRFVQIPTTLLAQVDIRSAVRLRSTRRPARTCRGVYQPRLVLADTASPARCRLASCVPARRDR